MPEPYSDDLRKMVINSLKKGTKVVEIVEQYDIKKLAIYNWKKQYDKTGNYSALSGNKGRKPILSKDQMENIKETILEAPDITLEELKVKLDLPICISALCRIINNKLKLRYKKNSTCKRTKQRGC